MANTKQVLQNVVNAINANADYLQKLNDSINAKIKAANDDAVTVDNILSTEDAVVDSIFAIAEPVADDYDLSIDYLLVDYQYTLQVINVYINAEYLSEILETAAETANATKDNPLTMNGKVLHAKLEAVLNRSVSQEEFMASCGAMMSVDNGVEA